MSNVKIELNSDGVRELLRSQEMLEICIEQAEQIKSRYADDAEVDARIGEGRANAAIIAPFNSALENNSLLKAVRE